MQGFHHKIPDGVTRASFDAWEENKFPIKLIDQILCFLWHVSRSFFSHEARAWILTDKKETAIDVKICSVFVPRRIFFTALQ
jgi:hypothetical protein